MKKLIVVLLMLGCIGGHAQPSFSFATDLSLMRNFSPGQEFWCIGQTLQLNFHFNRKQTAYAWLNYYTPGKFSNNFTALAKLPATSPSTIPFEAASEWKINEVSLGWKHYFKGGFDAEYGFNIYSIAGFGVMSGKVENTFSPAFDTSQYTVPLLQGTGKFYRLTLDLGAGVEYPLGTSFSLYGDLRTWLPASDYPSPYLYNNKNIPLPLMIHAGMRILFGN